MFGTASIRRFSRPDSAAARRYTYLALLAGIVIYVAGSLTFGQDKVERVYLPFVFGVFLFMVTLGCASEAVRHRRDRRAWIFLGAGIGLWLLAAVCRLTFFGGEGERPIPAWIDPIFLAFYPLVFTGLTLVIRARLRRFNQTPWLDGLAGVLVVVALSLAFLHEPFRDYLGRDGLEAIVVLSYPLGDLILLALVGCLLWINGLRTEGPWPPIAAGLGLFAIADVLFAVLPGDSPLAAWPMWTIWMLATLLIVVGTWRDDTDVRELTPGVGQLLLPLGFTVAAVAVLLAGQTRQLLPGAIWFSIATLLVVAFRLIHTVLENQKLFESWGQALTDELTGLASRKQIERWLADIGKGGRPPAVLLLLLNLNRFKELNAALGPRAGDEVLSAIGSRLNRSVGPYGKLGRLGGDEFLLIVADPKLCRRPAGIAGEITESLAPAFSVDGLGVHIDASIGAAASTASFEVGHELLRRSDVAMREARTRGIGFLLYSGTESDLSRERLQLLEDFRAGLEGDELVLHYQPKVLIDSGTVDSAEALIRWQHPQQGLLGPFRFLEIAEHAGLMHTVTERVLQIAIEQMATWSNEGLDLGIAINLAMPNLLDTALPREVQRLLETHGIDPSRLTLEITENIVMSDPDRVLGNLSRLNALGVRISLDDFGVGNTSLSYLRRLPLDEVKLDRSLIGNMTASPEDAIVARAAISVTQELGLNVVAEGVEDLATVEALAILGCGEIQGFYFAKPMPAREFTAWLSEFELQGPISRDIR